MTINSDLYGCCVRFELKCYNKMQDTTQPDEYIPRPVYNKKENKLISMTYEKSI